MAHGQGIRGAGRRWLVVAVALPASLASGLAQAEVIAIGPGGTAQRFAGPTTFIGATATPIAQAADNNAQGRAPVRRAGSGQVLAPALLAPVILEAARRQGIDPALVDAVAHQESRYRMDAVSRRGALGVMQLMPGTAQDLGVDPYDVTANIHGGAAYLRLMLDRYDGNERLALAAYNAGPGAVDRHGGVPPFAETRGYVIAVERGLSLRRQGRTAPATNAPHISGPTSGRPTRPPEVIDLTAVGN